MWFRLQTASVTAVCVASVLTLAACGGSSSSQTGPSPSRSVTVNFPGGPIYIGSTTPFEARETLPDGTTRVAEATWSSDRSQVASVSNLGVVTAIAAGEASISADVSGARGSQLIRVLPNFGGAWSGIEVAATCVDSGQLSGFCSLSGLTGQSFLHGSSFTQNMSSVTGVLTTNDNQHATMTGTISVDGELQLNSAQALPPDPDFNMQVENWRSRADMPSRMTGTYDIIVTVPGVSGSARLGMRLDTVVKASASTASRRRDAASASKLSTSVRQYVRRGR